MTEHVLLVCAQDLLVDVLQRTARWPKRLRYGVTGRLEGLCVDLACAVAAADRHRRRPRVRILREADGFLASIRVLLRVAHDLDILSKGAYAHLGRRTDEIGRLLGGWLRAEGRPRPVGAGDVYETGDRSSQSVSTGPGA